MCMGNLDASTSMKVSLCASGGGDGSGEIRVGVSARMRICI